MAADIPRIYLFFLVLSVAASLISQSLLDLGAIVFGLGVLNLAIRRRQMALFFKPVGFEVYLFLFFLSILASLVFRAEPFHPELLIPLIKFKWLPFCYAVIYACRNASGRFSDAMKLLSYFLLLPSCYALFTKATGQVYIPGHSQIFGGRVAGLVNSATYHAHAGALLFVFCALYLYRNWQKARSLDLVVLVSTFLLGLSVYFTYTRGAIFALVCACLASVFIASKKHFLVILALLIVVGSAAIKMDPLLTQRLEQSIDPERIDPSRLGLLAAHKQMFRDHFWFGFGYDLYRDSPVMRDYAHRFGVPDSLANSHAHNQYLQMLSSTGILGGLSFVLLHFYILFVAWRNYRNNDEAINTALLATQFCLLLLYLTDQTFEYAKIQHIIVVSWALIFWQRRIRSGAEKALANQI